MVPVKTTRLFHCRSETAGEDKLINGRGWDSNETFYQNRLWAGFSSWAESADPYFEFITKFHPLSHTGTLV